jgi:hypothetical protein
MEKPRGVFYPFSVEALPVPAIAIDGNLHRELNEARLYFVHSLYVS